MIAVNWLTESNHEIAPNRWKFIFRCAKTQNKQTYENNMFYALFSMSKSGILLINFSLLHIEMKFQCIHGRCGRLLQNLIWTFHRRNFIFNEQKKNIWKKNENWTIAFLFPVIDKCQIVGTHTHSHTHLIYLS